MPELPDVEILERTFFQFNRSLNANMNFAVASALGEQAREQREQSLDAMQAELEKLDGSVTQSIHYAEVMEAAQTRLGLSDDELEANGTALNAEMTKIYAERGYDKDEGFAVRRLENGTIQITRMEPSGELKLVGDPTDPNGYEPVMELRTIDIPPPDSVKTVATGSLFQEWDMNGIMDTHFKNTAQFSQYVTGMGDVVNDILSNAGAGVSRTLTHYSNQVQDQVSRAAQARALAEHIIGGGTLEEFGVSQVKGEIAQTLSEVWNIPADWFLGIMNGQKPHEMLKDYYEGQALDRIAGSS